MKQYSFEYEITHPIIRSRRPLWDSITTDNKEVAEYYFNQNLVGGYSNGYIFYMMDTDGKEVLKSKGKKKKWNIF